jgi:protein-disulfide isomerase
MVTLIGRMGRVAQLAVVLALAAVVVVGAIVVSTNGAEEASPTPEPGGPSAAEEVAELYAGIPQDGMRLGERGAPATLVEIADLQCPFCAMYSVQAMPAVVRDYVRTGRIAYELRIRSFLGRDSVRAAGAAAAAGDQDLKFQFVDLFFRNQGPENSDYADAAFTREIASQVEGLDVESVVAAADDPLGEPAVRRDEEFAREIGSTGTPDFYLRRDGRLTPLQVPDLTPEALAAALDAALGSS